MKEIKTKSDDYNDDKTIENVTKLGIHNLLTIVEEMAKLTMKD